MVLQCELRSWMAGIHFNLWTNFKQVLLHCYNLTHVIKVRKEPLTLLYLKGDWVRISTSVFVFLAPCISIAVRYATYLPGCPACAICTPASIGCCWAGAPDIGTCCMPEAPAMMAAAPGWPDWTDPPEPGGLRFDSPFPKATAATSALVSAGLKVCLFCRKPVEKEVILEHFSNQV